MGNYLESLKLLNRIVLLLLCAKEALHRVCQVHQLLPQPHNLACKHHLQLKTSLTGAQEDRCPAGNPSHDACHSQPCKQGRRHQRCSPSSPVRYPQVLPYIQLPCQLWEYMTRPSSRQCKESSRNWQGTDIGTLLRHAIRQCCTSADHQRQGRA